MKVRPFDRRLDVDDEYKWFLDEASLMRAQINLVVYIINNTNGFQIPLAQISAKVQDIYAHKPSRVLLQLNEPDKVTFKH